MSYFTEDIEEFDELKKQISLYHKNEKDYSGINKKYIGIRHKLYNQSSNAQCMCPY